MSAPRLLFLVTEDWFFRSHFLPLAERARREGFEVIVAGRDTGVLSGAEGLRVIDMPFARGSLQPWDIARQVSLVRAIVNRERPDIVHAIALKPIALLAFARIRSAGRVFALTGRGYLAIARSPVARLARGWLRRLLRRELDAVRSHLLVENGADAQWVAGARPLNEGSVTMMPGAGVDPDAFSVAPERAGPIVVGIVCRLVRSKGVDIAVEAVRRLRGGGCDVTLRIAGAVDPENPEHVSDEELARWRATPGVSVLGRVDDVNAFWAGAHIACLPSRGGEGLPRALLEAGACGRPIVTTDTPGCSDFVRHEETGLIAPPEVEALANALQRLADDGGMRARLGAAGRARVCAHYTLRHASDACAAAWRQVAARALS